MAASTKKRKGLTRTQLVKIWASLDQSKWLGIANERKRDHDFSPRGASIIGKCINPEHADNNPSFHLNIEKKYARCYGCGFRTNNPIQLVSLFLDCTTAEAVQYLIEQLELKFLSSKLTSELEAHRLSLLTKEAIYSAAHTVMCDAIADPTNAKYAFAKDALDWLINARQVPEDTLHVLPVGIMPSLMMLADTITDDYKKRHQAWMLNPGTNPEPKNLAEPATNYMTHCFANPAYNGSVLWPLHVTPDEIARIKLRLPHNRTPKDYVMPEDEYEDLLGLYGLGWDMYSQFYDAQTGADFVYVVEGEMDAMSLMARFVQGGGAKYPVMSVGGRGGAAHIEPILSSIGMKRVYIIGDAPHKKGDPIVQGWLGEITQLETRIFDGYDKWATPGGLPPGDLDEAVVALGEDKVTEVIHGNVKDNFSPAWEWAVNQASQEIDLFDPKDIRSIVVKAAEHGGYIRHHVELEAYADAISEKYQLNRHLLKREIASHEPTENGFIANCTAALKDLLFVVGTEFKQGQNWLVCFAKKQRSFLHIRIDSDQSIAQALAPMVGDIYDFVKDYVGFPVYMETPDNTDGEVRQRLDKKLRYALRAALSDLTRGAPQIQLTETIRQGYHRLHLYAPDSLETIIAEYIVCGLDVFHIDRSGPEAKFVTLEGPAHNGVIFDVGIDGSVHPSWYPGRLRIDTLERAKQIDVATLYADMVKMFDIGFTFKHQNTMPKLLAALVLVFPIMDAFPRPPWLYITGDSGSGKSTLTQVFSSGRRYPLKLAHHSRYYKNTSAPQLANACHMSTLAACLDENEFEGRKLQQTEELMEMLRGMANDEATRERATSGGGSIIRKLRFPLVMNGIHGARNAPDFNRFITVEMQKVENRSDPYNSVMAIFTEEQIRTMALQSTVCLFPHVPELLAIQKDVSAECDKMLKEKPVPHFPDWRFLSGIIPMLSVMKFVGIDWRSYLLEYIQSNSSLIERATSISESDSYLSSMMVSAVIQISPTRKMSIQRLLSDPDQWDEINDSSCGAFFDKDQKLLLFLLPLAIQQLLPSNLRFMMTTFKMKDILERHRMALTPDEIVRSGIMKKITPVFGAGVKLQEVAVIRADNWIPAQPAPSAYTTTQTTPKSSTQTAQPQAAVAATPGASPDVKPDFNTDLVEVPEDYAEPIPQGPKPSKPW